MENDGKGWLPRLPEGKYQLLERRVDGAHLIDKATKMSVICSIEVHENAYWLHVSGAYADHAPAYEELAALKADFFGDNLEAYQVFPRKQDHVNIHPFALHLYGRADGCRMLPDFTMGTGGI